MEEQVSVKDNAGAQSRLTDRLGDGALIDGVIRGWERIGSVGDLRTRYLAALGQGEQTQVWVVGCFDNPNRPPQSHAGGVGCQSELFALAWQLVLLGVRSTMEQATTFLRGQCRRMLLPCRHQDLQDILEQSIESPNGEVRGRPTDEFSTEKKA